MGAERTSNKDILAAINEQTSAINALVGALTQPKAEPVVSEPVAAPVNTPAVNSGTPEVKVPAGYMTHQRTKAQDHATAKGERVVLYARENLNGETKLAYCLASRWSSLRDNGLIGAIDTFDPAK